LRTQLIAVEDDLGLRLIKLEIAIGVDKQTTGESLSDKLLSEGVELPGLSGRDDNELHREISASRQRRRRQWDDTDTRNFGQRTHRFHQ
jgi:hypothetical protein